MCGNKEEIKMKKNRNLIKKISIIAVVIIVITLIYFAVSNSNKSTTPEETSGVETASETTSVVEEEKDIVKETTEDNTPVVETTTRKAINNKEVYVHLDDDKISALCGDENDNLSSSEDRLSKEKAKADALADAKAEEIMPKEAEEQDEGLVSDAFVSIKTENPTHKVGKYGNTTVTTDVTVENNVLVED